MGIGANESMRSGKLVLIDELFALPQVTDTAVDKA
jgi:hypothetical protein